MKREDSEEMRIGGNCMHIIDEDKVHILEERTIVMEMFWGNQLLSTKK